MAHQKHTKLSKPHNGYFGSNEWSILGTTCSNIQQLANDLSHGLKEKYKIGYVDADHKNAETEQFTHQENSASFQMTYTDKIGYHRFDSRLDYDTYTFRSVFNEMDMVIVNGNHFQAKKQIVVIDPVKEESLSRKLDRLTDVELILFTQAERKFPAYLEKHLSDLTSIPALGFHQTDRILSFLEQKMHQAVPPLYGLVLSGGKSTRMGRDKGQISYHGKPQRLFLADILTQLCEKTFLSVRTIEGEKEEGFPLLADSFYDLGPFGGIASAFRSTPNVAWMVVACDLPLLDLSTLKYLTENRNPSAVATAFNSPWNEFPEPLISIWEPRSYPVLLQFLAQGYSCPRKVLINAPVQLIDVPDGKKLMNVNQPEEYREAMRIIQKK